VVLAADGSPLATLYRDENRVAVSLDELPPVVSEAVLAVEDAHFYEHGGVNVRSVGRALVSNVEAGGVEEGGSTITQQLVKISLVGSKRDLMRKVKEAVLAARLERQLTKHQILERYLNTAYFGNGAYGVEAASELYFGIPAKELDLPKASMLAGIIRFPVGYDPFVHPDALRQRLVQVVARLRDQKLVPPDGGQEILDMALPTEPASVPVKPDDYFVAEVVRRLLLDPALGDTEAERYNAVFRGGLTIRTTLQPNAQAAAEEAIRDKLPDTEGRFTAAVVSVEPATGAIRAMVGGAGFEQSKYNIVTDGIGRPVGSSFKPFVLAAALEDGISPLSTIAGAGPCVIPNPGGTPDPYKGENYEGTSGGTESLYDATRHSLNCAFIRLGQIVGAPKLTRMAQRLGVTTELVPVLTTAIGVNEIRPLDMAAAYATFAADGVRHDPYLVEEITGRDGKVLLSHEDTGREVLDPGVAATVTDILRGVVERGTGTAARLPDGRPVAGKTGTTDNFGDAWFVGYTPQLSTAVWMGSPVDRTSMRNIGGVLRVTGGTFPAQIWGAYMSAVMDGLPIVTFPTPPKAAPGVYLQPGRTNVRDDEVVVRRNPPSASRGTTVPSSPSGPTTTTPSSGSSTPTTTPTTPTTATTPTAVPPPTSTPVPPGGAEGDG
jgi:penicillin-binding protein 1A